jgi:hypothetical protein
MEFHKRPGPEKQAGDEGIVDSHDIRHNGDNGLGGHSEKQDTDKAQNTVENHRRVKKKDDARRHDI